MEVNPLDSFYSKRLTQQEQKLLFKRWENQQRQAVAAQSEPTVKDIAEAYDLPPQEVARQLQEMRAEQHQAIVNASKRRQIILAIVLLCAPAILIVGLLVILVGLRA